MPIDNDTMSAVERKRLRDRQYRERHKEERNAKNRRYHELNKDEINSSARAARASDGGRELALQRARRNADREGYNAKARVYRAANPDKHKQWRLKKTHGIDLATFNEMLRQQRFRCAICRTPFGDLKRTHPKIDHCHDTGQVRGILCNGCNLGLGHFRDSPTTLTRAIQYLCEKRF
jgi:hypothetical protein